MLGQKGDFGIFWGGHGSFGRLNPPMKFGECAFNVAAPNDLLLHVSTIINIHTFKPRLKTHLFCKFYDLEYDFM